MHEFRCLTARRFAIALGMGLLFVLPGTALADAIDGQWCFTDGKSLSIDGSAIMTPGGSSIQGLYDRHAFEYTAPASEKDAGATVSMTLISDDVLHLMRTAGRNSAASANPEVWKRCKQQMS
jgi:hypothetical protein